MKRWNIHILLAKPCLASKENITIQKLYGTIRYNPHLIPVDHLTEPVEKYPHTSQDKYHLKLSEASGIQLE